MARSHKGGSQMCYCRERAIEVTVLRKQKGLVNNSLKQREYSSRWNFKADAGTSKMVEGVSGPVVEELHLDLCNVHALWKITLNHTNHAKTRYHAFPRSSGGRWQFAVPTKRSRAPQSTDTALTLHPRFLLRCVVDLRWARYD